MNEGWFPNVQYRSNVSYHRRALRESRRALQESLRARRRRNCKFTKLSSCAIFCYYLWKETQVIEYPLRSEPISVLIIKITISSLVIGLKKAYFPLIRLPSCYRTVCYWTVCYWTVCYWTVCYRTVQKANHIQRCSLKQPITFKLVITCACACACFCVCFFFGFAFVL